MGAVGPEITWQITKGISGVDYVVLGVMLGMSTGIGMYFHMEGKRKGRNRDVEYYLLAGRSLEAWPTGLSLTANFIES